MKSPSAGGTEENGNSVTSFTLLPSHTLPSRWAPPPDFSLPVYDITFLLVTEAQNLELIHDTLLYVLAPPQQTTLPPQTSLTSLPSFTNTQLPFYCKSSSPLGLSKWLGLPVSALYPSPPLQFILDATVKVIFLLYNSDHITLLLKSLG